MIEDKILFDDYEDETENELKVDVSKFDQAVIWGTDWTTETIALQLEKGNIDLNPIFQRRDAWSNKEKSLFVESLILGLPVPPIILAENKGRKNSYIVIDGKQRLLSIRRFYSKNTDTQFENHEVNIKDAFKQLKLSGLDVLKEFNGLTYEDLTRRDRDAINSLDNQAVRTVVIKNWPDESFLYTVFLRLNTGSKKLSSQELRQALKPGKFLSYLDEATADSSSIKKMLNNTEADSRMRDVELALRYYGFRYFIEKYDGVLKTFLDTTCDVLNKQWDGQYVEIQKKFKELEDTINFVFDLVSQDSPFSRIMNGRPNNRFNRSIFELFTYYFSNEKIRQLVYHDKIQFKASFKELNEDNAFIDAISATTKNKNKLITRFQLFSQMLVKLPSFAKSNIKIPYLILKDDKIKLGTICKSETD